MDIRGQAAKVRGNREKALLYHIFNKAREWGYTALLNPCQGVKGFKEIGRSGYITDAEFNQVKAHAHFEVIDAIDFSLLTGQRPADVLKLKRTDIRDGALWIVQNKTGQRLGVEVTGELSAVNARIAERPRRAISAWLIQGENGQLITQFALRSRFDKARTLSKVDFQFRDIQAKAATDTGDLAHSQTLLGHKKSRDDRTLRQVEDWRASKASALRLERSHFRNLMQPTHQTNMKKSYGLV